MSTKRRSYGPLLWCALWVAPYICTIGCASPAKQVLTSANGYHYWTTRHAERCPSETESICKGASVITRWYTALQEANAALQRGGKLPLQLRALKQVEKESKRWTP